MQFAVITVFFKHHSCSTVKYKQNSAPYEEALLMKILNCACVLPKWPPHIVKEVAEFQNTLVFQIYCKAVKKQWI